jgi:uncharacterized membrane protein
LDDAPYNPPVSRRLEFIDWLRGFAVVCMIVWHAIDAWTLPAARTGSLFDAIATAGGFAAPLFLFLAGVSVALAGSGRAPREDSESSSAGARARGGGAPRALMNDDRRAASWRLQKRGWEIFLIAHLFRLTSFVFNPMGSWSGILKPDILNILGLGLVAAAFCWGRATSHARKVAWLLAPAAAIVLVAPWVRRWPWLDTLHEYAPRLEAYFRPVPGIGVFNAFPWIAFVFAGAIIGSLMAESPTRADDSRSQRWLAAGGAGIALTGFAGSFLPSLTGSEFWTTSLSLFLIRVGVMTVGLTLAWVWLARPWRRWVSPVVLLGRASLFVYWVHIELAYGFVSYPFHRKLPLGRALVAFALLTALMAVAAHFWLNRRKPLVPAYLRA